MTGAALLQELHRRGVHVRVEDDRLKLSVPPGTDTDDLTAALRQNKPVLMRMLGTDLQERVNRVGTFMQAIDTGATSEWSAAAWSRRRDEALRELAEVEAVLKFRGETLETYGWYLDPACRWQRVGEEPLEPEAPDWTVFTDAELVEIVAAYGARLHLDDGRLRAEGAAGVPPSLKVEIRARQTGLVAVLEATAPDGARREDKSNGSISPEPL